MEPICLFVIKAVVVFGRIKRSRQVTSKLQPPYVYLMSFILDLLPGNSIDTVFILEVCYGKQTQKSCCSIKRTPKEISQEPSQDSKCSSNEDTPTMIHDSRGNDDDIITVRESRGDSSTDNNTKDDDIFTQGLKLGRQPEE